MQTIKISTFVVKLQEMFIKKNTTNLKKFMKVINKKENDFKSLNYAFNILEYA